MVSARKPKWRTTFLCIGGAVVFWMLNALNKVYTTDISCPVVFIIDESRISGPKVPPPSVMHIEVSGRGWSLLRYLLRLNVQSVELPVTKISQGGHIESETLRLIFDTSLKDLKVRRVWIDETLRLHVPS
jgi:hypothetical protein